MSRDTAKLLRKTSIFSYLDPSSLSKISDFFKEETYTTGHIFFRDDAVNDILYVIRQGAVKIIKGGKSGEGKLSLILRREGDFFGETALIEETSPLETAQAIKKTEVLQLSRSDFLTILNNYPFVAFQIMKALTSRLRQSYLGLIEELGEKDEQLEEACAGRKFSPGTKAEDTRQSEGAVSLSGEMTSTFPFSIVGTKEDGTIFIFNKAAEEEYGYSSEEASGKDISLLRGDGNLSNLDELVKCALRDGGVWKGEMIAKRSNGEPFICETTVYSIAGAESNPPATLWIGNDVTSERSLAKQAMEKEKLRNVGERIREVALNFNDGLQLLSQNLDPLTHGAYESSSPRSQARLKAAAAALDDLREIVIPLATFPLPPSVKEPVYLANFIERELLSLRLQERFEGIDFITKYDDGLPPVDVDPHQMRQLLVDLLDNAAFALNSVSDREKAITVEVRYLAREEEVEIQVLDNGIGIAESDLAKVFKEHFTTKGKGFGFGLLSIKRAVESHGGAIQVQSIEGAYTLFTIRFPAKKQVSVQDEKCPSGMIPPE